VFVEPCVEVRRVEPDQAADPNDRDAALLHQPTEVPNARAQLLSHGVDVEQPAVAGRDRARGEFGECV
jgi:hypothetical protein